jgi:S1-C subfamily serine protease
MATAVQMRLGAEFRALTAKELEKYGLEAKIGVAITKLSQNSPLKEAGIEVDDIILGVDGQMVEDMDAFIGFISTIPKDQKVSLLILDHRTGSTGSLDVMLK